MSEEKKEITNVQQIDINLDEILGIGADAVMTAEEKKEAEKPSIFSSMTPNTTFLDKAEDPEDPDKDPDPEDPDKSNTSFLDPEDPKKEVPEDPDPEDPDKGGRPKTIVSVTKNLIEKGLLHPFDDDKDIKDYTTEDFEELLEANMTQYQQDLAKQLPEQFMKALPSELQQAYQYVANGGTDIKGMFQALSQSVETQELDISNVEGQKQTIRAYLQATNWGTPDEIEDEVYSLEDGGTLEKKANQFKPKLDNMQQQIVQQKIEEQKKQADARQKQSQLYIDSVYNTLETGELNGIKLDNKTQNMLYAGLVQTNYPSISGKQTNMLGHLLEKHQWVEPRHDLIAEALWLLADPDGYHKQIAQNIETEVNKKTLRSLKTEQGRKEGSSIDPKAPPSPTRKGIKRPSKNFFER